MGGDVAHYRVVGMEFGHPLPKTVKRLVVLAAHSCSLAAPTVDALICRMVCAPAEPSTERRAAPSVGYPER